MNLEARSVSQANAENALKREMRSGRFSHALLLSGQQGIGKKTLARFLAKGLLCTCDDPSLRPCGICRSCKRFESATHANFLTPDLKPTDKSIKIEAIRTILDALSHHSLENGARVVLLENAERMTVQAQNCLLKSLEEAAGNTHFILTADSERSILPTILSRCRIERMQPWEDERIAAELRTLGLDHGKIAELVSISEGSIGKALSVLQDSVFWNAKENVLKTFFSIRKSSDIPKCLSLLKDKRDDSSLYLEILEQDIARYLRTKAAGSEGENSPSPHWEHASIPSLQRILDAVLHARQLRAANVGWQAVAEQLMLIISEEVKTWQQ